MQSVLEIYGSALASYYNGKKDGQIILREKNDFSVIQTSQFFQYPDDVTTDRIALSYCQNDVLNIAANSGEHSLYLINKGLNVISLERSPIACAIMHQRGVPSILCADLFENTFMLERCQTWLALNTAIGQLGNIRNCIKFLQLAHRNLNPGGRIVISANDMSQEGYRTRNISFEFDGNTSESTQWFDIGMTTLKQIAERSFFNCRIVYVDEKKQYIAVLIKD